jgi:hypothetical protein
LNAAGGFNYEAIRALTGIPVFDYLTTNLNSTFSGMIHSAFLSNFVLGHILRQEPLVLMLQILAEL